jgi:vacuolar-type H+-ATPase subunit I/STV1
VEFFSKFYKGNGREFRPFSSPRNYTIKQFSLEPLAAKSKK